MFGWLTRPTPLQRLAQQKQDAAKHCRAQNAGTELLQLLAEPLPPAQTPLAEINCLVVDFETSGLNPAHDHILSVGMVDLSQQKLRLESAETRYVCAPDKVKADSAVINHITPEMLTKAEPLDAVMARLFQRLQGKALLVHGAAIEQGFIEAYLSQRVGLTDFPQLVIDTLKLEQGRLQHPEQQLSGDYRLATVRERLGLPSYPGHGALVDAVATGELYLALTKKIYGRQSPSLTQFYRGVHARR